jgi:hypothetical protein
MVLVFVVANGCQMPPEIEYGYYVLESVQEDDSIGRASVGQRAHYNCNLGYNLTEPGSLQCLDSGDWSPRLPPRCTLASSGKKIMHCTVTRPIKLL